MKATFTFFLLLTSTLLFSQSNYQHWKWAKSFGGSGNDSAVSMKIKNGFLYVTGNYSSASINWDGTTLNNSGGSDIFLAKIDTANGNTIWVKTFGGAGMDSVLQLEVNNSGTTVLRCTSTGSTVTIGSTTLTSPKEFYFTVNTLGSVSSANTLSPALKYSDIGIDVTGSVYIAARHFRSFMFAGVLSDSSFCAAGAAVLKYGGNGNESWAKILQCSYSPNGGPYNSADSISLQLEVNNFDTSVQIMVSHYGYMKIGNTIVQSGGGVPRSLYLKLSPTSNVLLMVHDFPTYSGGRGSIINKFITGNNGLQYSVYSPGSPDLHSYLKKSYDTSRQYTLETSYISSNGNNFFLEINLGSLSESGNHILGSGYNKNIVVWDTLFAERKRAYVSEISSLYPTINNMADTNALYISSNLRTSSLLLNSELPPVIHIPISIQGQSDIFIGKFDITGLPIFNLAPVEPRIKICADSLQLKMAIIPASSQPLLTYTWTPASIFSNPNILNPKIHIPRDSVAATLTISDGNGFSRTASLIFYRGIDRDLQLVPYELNVCRTVQVTLTGSYFEPCKPIADPEQPDLTAVDSFSTATGRVNYILASNHKLSLAPTASTSRSCFNNVINIVKNPSYNITTRDSICYGSSFRFPDGFTVTNVTTNINHWSYLRTSLFCDSMILSYVSLYPVYNFTNTVNICRNSTYIFPDGFTATNISANLTHTSHLNSIHGCDSVVTTTVRPTLTSFSRTDSITICRGSNYTFPDGTSVQNVLANTSHTSILNSTTGCDTTIKTYLLIAPAIIKTKETTVCSGSNYTFPDGSTQQNITVTVSQTSHFTASNGCDSSVVTTVRIYPVYNIEKDTSICSGSSFTFPDGSTQSNISVAVNQTSHLTTINGCDSNIVTTVHVRPAYTSTVSTVACKGTTVTFPDGSTQVIHVPTDYSSNLSTHLGCDSIINSHVTVVITDTSITKNGTGLSSNNAGATYQWIDCSTQTAIPSATAQLYTATAVGDYAVAVTKDGCTDTSACYPVTITDILGGRVAQITLFPVPAHNSITILFQSETSAELFTTLINPSGLAVRQTKTMLTPGVNTIVYPLDNLVADCICCVFINLIPIK